MTRRGRDRTVDPRRLLADERVDRVVSKRGTVTFARGSRAVVLPLDPALRLDRAALLLAPGEDNHEPNRPPATLRLDRAALLDYAAVLLAAAAELPDGDAAESAPHRRAADLSVVVTVTDDGSTVVVPEEDLP